MKVSICCPIPNATAEKFDPSFRYPYLRGVFIHCRLPSLPVSQSPVGFIEKRRYSLDFIVETCLLGEAWTRCLVIFTAWQLLVVYR